MSSGFLASFTKALAVKAHSSAAAQPQGPPRPQAQAFVQPLDPAIAWDWPNLGPNQISLQQWNFCDTQPASSAAGQTFASGTGSFSDAYRAFLELVDPATFVPVSMLTSARDAAAFPTVPVGSGVGSPGFIVVPNSGGVGQFKPEWLISMTPGQWAIDQASGFHYDAGALSGFFRGTSEVAALDARRRDTTLNVTDLARVLVYPGAWYSDSFVRLAATGPFVGARPPRDVVGPGGILRCRVTEFLVAAEFAASATFDPSDAQALMQHLASAPATRIGPLAAADAKVQATPVAGGTRVAATTPQGKPFIVAVSVQPIAS